MAQKPFPRTVRMDYSAAWQAAINFLTDLTHLAM
jgi:hypothetical protein